MAEEKSVEEKEVTEVKAPAVKAKKAPAKKAKAEPKAQNVVDIADFFTTTREKEGVWYELKIQNIGIGIEVLTYGPASKQAFIAEEKFNADVEKLQSINDPDKRKKKADEIIVNRAVAVVGGIRMKDGSAVVERGKPVKDFKATMRRLFEENTDIRDDYFAAARLSVTFMR